MYGHLSSSNVSVTVERYFVNRLGETPYSSGLSILLQVGFTRLPALPQERCALTAPFHPYQNVWRLFSVALSLKSPSPGFLRHPVSKKFGLSSLAVSLRPRDRITILKAVLFYGFKRVLSSKNKRPCYHLNSSFVIRPFIFKVFVLVFGFI